MFLENDKRVHMVVANNVRHGCSYMACFHRFWGILEGSWGHAGLTEDPDKKYKKKFTCTDCHPDGDWKWKFEETTYCDLSR